MTGQSNALRTLFSGPFALGDITNLPSFIGTTTTDLLWGVPGYGVLEKLSLASDLFQFGQAGSTTNQ